MQPGRHEGCVRPPIFRSDLPLEVCGVLSKLEREIRLALDPARTLVRPAQYLGQLRCGFEIGALLAPLLLSRLAEGFDELHINLDGASAALFWYRFHLVSLRL